MHRNLGKDNKNSNNNNSNKIIHIDETLGEILLAITNVNRKRDKDIEKTLQIKRTKYTVQCKESLNSFDLVTFLLILYFFQEKPIMHNDKEIATNFYENKLKKLLNNESETNYEIINFYKYMIKKIKSNDFIVKKINIKEFIEEKGIEDKTSNRKTIFESIKRIANVEIKISKDKEPIKIKKLLSNFLYKKDNYSEIIFIIDKELILKKENTYYNKFIDLNKILHYKNYYSALLFDFYFQFYCHYYLSDDKGKIIKYLISSKFNILNIIKILKYDKLKLEKKYQVRKAKKVIEIVLKNHGYRYNFSGKRKKINLIIY